MSSFSQFESDEVDIDYDEILNELGLVEPNYEILNELGPFGLEMSEISHSMFNGLVNEGFDRKARVVDLKSILERELLPRSPIGNGLYLQTTELKGVYGRFTIGLSDILSNMANRVISMRSSLQCRLWVLSLMITAVQAKSFHSIYTQMGRSGSLVATSDPMLIPSQMPFVVSLLIHILTSKNSYTTLSR